MKNICILGSTGSIGTQTMEIVRAYKDDLKVVSMSAAHNTELMEKQVREVAPSKVCMFDEKAAEELRARIADTDTKVLSGMEGLIELCEDENCEMVVTAVVGMIGIRPTIAAINAGKDIALANKETLVCAGHIIMPLAKKMGVKILPVDSEHSAIFQSLQGFPRKSLERILLTASGGPFRGKKREELVNITWREALKHPNWTMGKKVTIDSSTLVNKGLEVMEASWLFDVTPDKITVVIQPQSIIHSAVQYVDGGIIAQLGTPDMKLPIQYALFYPDRRPMDEERLDLFKIGQIGLEKPDTETFKGLKLAYRAANEGGSLPTVFNAANEKAVALFLEDKIRFLDIYDIIEKAMDEHKTIPDPGVEEILNAEKECYELIDSMEFS
ncbi:MAG: 1-deoxy-D-xylulose-5-phosphate reductoisomerase [Lachnospiraceae bacterium]|nr:1-deoxy-D-xylulose-5-phosphate reductoisomerase [Lachnospiraceae bacterium]